MHRDMIHLIDYADNPRQNTNVINHPQLTGKAVLLYVRRGRAVLTPYKDIIGTI